MGVPLSIGTGGGGSSGASTALDNLASVAINTSLISDTDNTDDLGSAAKQWRKLYAVDGTFTGIITAAVGSAAAPSVKFASDQSGLFQRAAGTLGITVAGTQVAEWLNVGGFLGLRIGTYGVYGASGITAGPDTALRRKAAGVYGADGGDTAGTSAGGFQPAQSANGATVQILGISELLTLSIAGTTTDTTANLLPAGAIIKTVVARVTTTITTATDWQVGDPTTAGRFTPVNATMTAGTVDIGRVHMTTGIASATTGMYQAAAAKVRITTTGTPGAGAVRLTTFYELLTPPTS